MSDHYNRAHYDKRYNLLLVAWLLLFLLLCVITAGTYPPVNYNLGDEVWAYESSKAYVAGTYDGGLLSPRLYFSALGHFLELSGGGIQAARIFSALAAVVALLITYLLGREMSGPATGLLASVILGTTFAFSWHSRIVRHETLTTATVLLAVYLMYLAHKRKLDPLLLLSGAVAALSVYVHPNNLQYAIAIVPLYLLLYRRGALSWNTAWLLGGLGGGFALWLLVSYAPVASPGTGVVGAIKGLSGVSPFPLINRDFFGLLAESLLALPMDYVRYVGQFDEFFPNTVAFAVPAVGALVLWVLGLISAERFKVLWVLGFVVMTNFISYFIVVKYGYWHMVEHFPFFALAAALSLKGISDRLGGRAGTLAVAAGALFFVTVGTVDTALTYNKFRHYDYDTLLREVSEGVDGKVLAMQLYAPAFKDVSVVGPWFQLDRPGENCVPIERKIEELGVKYIVADNLLRKFSRLSCGPKYEKALVRYLLLKGKVLRTVQQRYPNYWAGGMIDEIYIIRTHVGLQEPASGGSL